MIVYLLTNRITKKKYIGQTIDSLDERWKQHKSKYSCCRYLKNSIEKYGAENFDRKILAHCNSIEEMNHRETYYIKIFNTLAPNGYNLNTGGNNRTPSDETRERMSVGNKGIKKPKSAEHARKLALARIGTKQTQEHKDKKAQALFQPVRVPELNIVFDSHKSAAKALGTHGHVIGKVINGLLPDWKGLTFRNVGRDAVTPISIESMALLGIFLKNKKHGWLGRKRPQEYIDNIRIKKQIPIFIPEINLTLDSIKITSEKLGISTHSIHTALKQNRALSSGLSFIKLKRGEVRGINANSEEGKEICSRILKNKKHAKIEILCVETGKKYSSCMEAARDINSHSSLFTRYFSGKLRHIKGFTFEKVETCPTI